METQLFNRLRKRVARKNPELSLRKTREKGWLRVNLGPYYIVNKYLNALVETHINLAELESELAARGQA